MPKYLVSWEESNWYDIFIEAPSKMAALDMFYNNEYDRENVAIVGFELIPDTIECEEV